MIYLKNFTLLDERDEYSISEEEKRNIFNNYYPLNIFTKKEFKDIKFNPITIFYGGNGSGKTTLINIITEKINGLKKTNIDKGSFFDLYVKRTEYEMNNNKPVEIKLITSDDVFDYLLDIRSINSNVNRRKEILSQEYLNYKFNDNPNYDELRDAYDAKKKSLSKYVRERLRNNNIIECSNGEEALMYWEREIKENGIYILDEPENSLSAENQLKLKKFIEDSVRFYNCQFIISTHSPFLLKLNEALIYDLDSIPTCVKKWNELSNVLIYYNFFKENELDFKEE